MVIAGEVQQSVDEQAKKLFIKGDFEFLCLLQCLRDRDDDVPKHDRPMMNTFVQQGERENVGIFAYPPILGIEEFHPPAVDEEDAQFR